MVKAKMCAYSQSDHALTHRKCVLWCCAKCTSINITDQKTYDKYPDTSPSIIFHIYHLIARYKKHGRLPLTDKIVFASVNRILIKDNQQKYTLEKIQWWWRQPFLIFIQVFIFQQFRSWRFILHTYKYWVRITVVTLVEMRLNAVNHCNMCYVAVIMMRG